MGDKAILATALGGDDPLRFAVVVREGRGETRHEVTLRAADLARLGEGRNATKLVEAAFAFLLDREPKEAILAGFDVSIVSRYFPEFENELPGYLRARA